MWVVLVIKTVADPNHPPAAVRAGTEEEALRLKSYFDRHGYRCRIENYSKPKPPDEENRV